jgi:hypothetical protein
MGFYGDLERGAYWWVGSEDRININCETGVVRLKNGIEVPSIKTDIIQGLTNTTVRIENNVVITGNTQVGGYVIVNGHLLVSGNITLDNNVGLNGDLLVSGNITALNSNPFWCAGVYDGFSTTRMSSKGRYGYTVARTTGYAAGVFTITMNTPYDSACYVINATIQHQG